MLVEWRLVEQRYAAVRDVLDNGATVTDVACRNGVTRSAVHEWLTKYAKHGLAGLVDRVVMADPQDNEFCVLTRAESIRPDRARPDTIGPLGF